ncbi:MAG: hypothetical protein NXH75_02445 [Halobacteriovoraceae bacterium]|nr:hypothetical protein [Halobacteriovoraceae bacterium]
MNNLNDSSKTLATPINTSKIKSKNRIVEVRVNNSARAAAASLSSRPSRSLFKTKSLVKPLTNNLKKDSPANS